MGGIEKDLWTSSRVVQPLCFSRVTGSQLLKTMSRWLPRISKDGDSIHNFAGQVMPVLSHPQCKNVFPGVYKERAVSDCAHQLLSVTGHHGKEPGSILIQIPALQVFVHIYEMSPKPSLCYAKQVNFSQLSLM